eukprot:XP_001695549.1 predicted protein [Chlamydomonas reinhardtii]
MPCHAIVSSNGQVNGGVAPVVRHIHTGASTQIRECGAVLRLHIKSEMEPTDTRIT